MFGCKTFISVKVKWKNALKLVLTAQSALVQQQWPTRPSLGPVLWRHATARAPQWGQNLIEIAIKYAYYFNITISPIFVCTGYSFWDWFRNFWLKFTWIVLPVHKLNKLGKFMDNCWISCQVMADMEKFYDNLIIINLYLIILE